VTAAPAQVFPLGPDGIRAELPAAELPGGNELAGVGGKSPSAFLYCGPPGLRRIDSGGPSRRVPDSR